MTVSEITRYEKCIYFVLANQTPVESSEAKG